VACLLYVDVVGTAWNVVADKTVNDVVCHPPSMRGRRSPSTCPTLLAGVFLLIAGGVILDGLTSRHAPGDEPEYSDNPDGPS
jgi:hypothetical protein